MNQNFFNKVHLLFVGKISQSQDIFQIVTEIAEKFAELTSCVYYFLDQNTVSKMAITRPDNQTILYNAEQHCQLLSFVLTIGGDGTILYAAKELKKKQVPIISFQKGTLGFMCRFQIDQINQVVKYAVKSLGKNLRAIDYPFLVNRTMRLSSRKKKQFSQEYEEQKLCVNEVSISRVNCERISLQIWIDQQFITETAGDGLLISTPTGSTAYSLSAGGPVLHGAVNGILIVPIAPNSLSFRPICVPSTSKIVVKVSENSRSEGYLSYDGQTNQIFSINEQIIVSRSDKDIIFLQPKNDLSKLPTWMFRLKHFLGWSETFKNPISIEDKNKIPLNSHTKLI